MIVHGQVTMMALMHAVDPKEICGGCLGGDRAFDAADEGRKIVIKEGNRSMLNGNVGSEDVLVTDDAGELEISVGDGAVGSVSRNEGLTDRTRKRGAPDEIAAIGKKPDPTHAGEGGVARSDTGGKIGDDLGDVGGPAGERAGEKLEVVEMRTDGRRDAHPMAITVLEPQLECAEKAAPPRDGENHAAQFAQDFVPFLDRDA